MEEIRLGIIKRVVSWPVLRILRYCSTCSGFRNSSIGLAPGSKGCTLESLDWTEGGGAKKKTKHKKKRFFFFCFCPPSTSSPLLLPPSKGVLLQQHYIAIVRTMCAMYFRRSFQLCNLSVYLGFRTMQHGFVYSYKLCCIIVNNGSRCKTLTTVLN